MARFQKACTFFTNATIRHVAIQVTCSLALEKTTCKTWQKREEIEPARIPKQLNEAQPIRSISNPNAGLEESKFIVQN